MLRKILLTIWHGILIAGAAFIMSSAWHWVQMMHKPRLWILGKILPLAGGLFVIFILIYAIVVLIAYKKNHPNYSVIKKRPPEALFIFSFVFLSVFGKTEWQCLLAFLIFSNLIIYYFWSWFRSTSLLRIWVFFVFFFCFVGLIQFFAHFYYILDINPKFTKTIPLLRTIAISFFWLSIVVSVFYLNRRGEKLSFVALITLLSFWFLYIFFAGLNTGVLRGSGLFISPTALQHAEGAIGLLLTFSNLVMIVFILFAIGLLLYLVKKTPAKLIMLSRRLVISLWLVAIIFWIITIKLIKIPGVEIANAFYQHYWGEEQNVVLSTKILNKLDNQFGLTYDPKDFYVGRREKTFNQPANLLPKRFLEKKPNILIVLWESYSAKLNDTYNSAWQNKLTPGTDKFANDKNTTIFKKYYNSSTPTVTGLLSMLCSFLPPTGHEEIANNNRFTRFYLSCLPDILDKEAGYKTISYITAVNKSYAHKDTIFENAGVKEIYGTEELKAVIHENTKSWGFSDYQMFNVLPEFLQKAQPPFLIMLSTVDSHQPYNMTEDAIEYGDGKSDVLNSFHTTDDAFGKFWDWFKESSFVTNTIVIVVADHAAFPTAYRQVPQFAELEKEGKINYYDENVFMINVPDSALPKVVDKYSSELDLTPTILHLLNINIPNTFDGYSIFEDREKYSNLLGMHELGLYINQSDAKGKRQELYQLPVNLAKSCDPAEVFTSSELTLCEYYQFYVWKRQMLEQGRLWNK